MTGGGLQALAAKKNSLIYEVTRSNTKIVFSEAMSNFLRFVACRNPASGSHGVPGFLAYGLSGG